MTIYQAIKILDPKTRYETIAEIEYYGGFSGKEAVYLAIDDACILAADVLKKTVNYKESD